MRYTKPPLTYEQQHDLLVDRGLIIPDRHRCIRWLRNTSYYRLSAYMLPFKYGERFVPGTTFEVISELYVFDRRLRLVLLDAIERIEVALRSFLAYELSHRFGPYGYSDPANFPHSFNHRRFMEEIAKAEADSRETFVAHYRGKYDDESFLPTWMITELVSFGTVSLLYATALPSIKKKFSSRLDTIDSIASSWLHTLSYVRNVCAHHSRIWNRHLALKPALPRNPRAWPYAVPSNERLYCVLVIIQHCLLRLTPHCKWRERLHQLFDDYPNVPLDPMGIPRNWRDLPIWNAMARNP